MTLTVNGHTFNDLRLIEPNTTWNEMRYSMYRAKPRLSRNSISSHALSLNFILKGPNCLADVEKLRGLMQQGELVILESTTQKLWGQSMCIIIKVLSFGTTEEAPTYWLGQCEAEYSGSPANTPLTLDVSTLQDFNDYSIAGQTTVGLPLGSLAVTDPGDGTNFAVTFRGSDPVVEAYDGLDTGVYTEEEHKQTSIEFIYDPSQGHDNAVQLYDGADPVTDSEHVFSSDWTLQNGQMKLVANGSEIEVQTTAGATQETFTQSGMSTSIVRILALSQEYCALQVNNSIVLELFRGRDVIFHVMSGDLLYVDAAGSAQESIPSDNALTVGNVFIASNGFFKTTASKEILLQDSGDTNESLLTTPPRFQVTIGSPSSRKLDVLKRQG